MNTSKDADTVGDKKPEIPADEVVKRHVGWLQAIQHNQHAITDDSESLPPLSPCIPACCPHTLQRTVCQEISMEFPGGCHFWHRCNLIARSSPALSQSRAT